MTTAAAPMHVARPTPPRRAAPTDEELKARARLLEKLVAIASRDPDCLSQIVTLTRDEEDFPRLIEEAERHVRELPSTTEERRVAPAAVDVRVRPLCERITRSDSLCTLFKSEPSFVTRAAREIATLAAMATLRPHPDLMVEAQDGPFMRILRHLAQPGATTAERLVFEDFLKLIALRHASADIVDLLWPVADADDWAGQSTILERSLRSGRQEPGMTAATATLFDRICGPDTDPKVAATLTDLLQRTPLLSEMLAEEVVAFKTIHVNLPQPESLFASDIYDGSKVSATEEEKNRRLAKFAYEQIQPDVLADIEARLELRQWAAEHCLNLRAFVKMNALERQWPELSRMLRADRATLKALEGEAMRPGTIAPEHKATWDRYAKDEQLRRFLIAKPHVTDINPRSVRDYFTVSATMMPSPELGMTGAADASVAIAAPRVRFDYVDLTLQLTSLHDAADGAETHETDESTDGGKAASDPAPTHLQVALIEPHQITKHDRVKIPWRKLLECVSALQDFARDSAPTSRAAADASTRDLMLQGSRSGAYSDALLREVGNRIAEVALPGAIGQRMRELHRTGLAYRIRLQIPPDLAVFPWETIHLEHERVFLALTQRYSLIRQMDLTGEAKRSAITAPLRILGVLSNPVDTAPLNLDGERAALEEALSAARAERRVSLEFLGPEESTVENLQRKLRMVRPHVFHFVGHGVFMPDRREGALAFNASGESRQVAMLSATSVATLLRDVGVSIAVLNSCDTGTSAHNDAITGVAGSLVHAGVPAVIATLREILDEAGLSFTTELYRAFGEGYTLEAALAEARKRLSVEGRDWSAYALFANAMQMETLAFPLSSAMPSR